MTILHAKPRVVSGATQLVACRGKEVIGAPVQGDAAMGTIIAVGQDPSLMPQQKTGMAVQIELAAGPLRQFVQ
jgi:hypothetical protein